MFKMLKGLHRRDAKDAEFDYFLFCPLSRKKIEIEDLRSPPAMRARRGGRVCASSEAGGEYKCIHFLTVSQIAIFLPLIRLNIARTEARFTMQKYRGRKRSLNFLPYFSMTQAKRADK